MIVTSTQITQFGLYGEAGGDLAPEFVHVEPISARSSLYEWTISPHAHPGIVQLLLVEAGEGVLADGEGEAPLPPGTLAVVPGGMVHAFRFVPGTQGWVLSLAEALLDDPRLAPYAHGSALRGARARHMALPQVALADALLGALHRRGPSADAVTMATLALLLALVDEAATTDQARAGPPDRRLALVRRFTALVEVRFREQWSVSRYAAELGTTPQTLTRACRTVLGKPPGDIALDRLLREGMRALTFTAAGVAQIAQDLGFADPAYFSRMFKARAGLQPSRFRRERAWLRG